MKQLFFLFAILLCGSSFGQQKDPLLDELRKITDSSALKARLLALEQGSEADMNTLAAYYLQKKDMTKREAILAAGAKRFPQSRLALEVALNTFPREKNAVKRKQMFMELKNRFANPTEVREFQIIATSLSVQSAKEKLFDDALFYAGFASNPKFFTMVVREVYKLDKVMTEALLENYIKVKAVHTDNADYSDLLALYVHVLVEKGDLKQASKYAKQAYQSSKGNEVFLKDYTRILQSEGDYQQIVKVLEEAVVNGYGKADIQDLLTAAYRNLGIDASTSLIKLNAKYREKVRKEVSRKIINKPSPMFVLKDERGKDVSLADYKGKTIIIDFWATWCAPCKASFPAMQKVVDRYRDDQNVRFLFVHTLEKKSESALEDAQKYLGDNNYHFDLFMDYRNPETEKCPVASSFEVTGIPAKFVIDGNGMIKFRSSGYNPKEIAAVEELSAMIELAKAKR